MTTSRTTHPCCPRPHPTPPHEPPVVQDLAAVLHAVSQAAEAPFGHSATATMLRKWEPGTVRTYLSALRQVLKYAPPDMPLPDALSLRLLHLAANRRSPSAAKALVSAVLMCQRLSLIPRVIADTHTLTLAAIVKYTGRYTIPKPWATVQHLEAIGRLRMYWGWARVFFLILCSVVYLWSVQDAAALQWHWLRVPGWVTFFDHKVNKHLVSYPLCDFLDTWRAYILACKRPAVPWDSPVLPGGTSELQRALQDLLRYEQLPVALWHGWKKLGAALFILWGGSMVSLQRWGRWHSEIQPRRYSNAPPAWRLPHKLQLPFPVATTNSPVRDMDWRLVPIPQLWPKDTFVKLPAAPIRAPLQLERACAAAVPPPSSARDSAAPKSLCESTDTDRFDTTSQCSDTSSVELSQPTDQAASGVPPTPHA